MYEERIIAFIDVLGFKNEINKKTMQGIVENEEESQRIYDFISLLHKDFEKKGLDDSTYNATQFSDSIIISYSKDEKASVFRILMSLLY